MDITALYRELAQFCYTHGAYLGMRYSPNVDGIYYFRLWRVKDPYRVINRSVSDVSVKQSVMEPAELFKKILLSAIEAAEKNEWK